MTYFEKEAELEVTEEDGEKKKKKSCSTCCRKKKKHPLFPVASSWLIKGSAACFSGLTTSSAVCFSKKRRCFLHAPVPMDYG